MNIIIISLLLPNNIIIIRLFDDVKSDLRSMHDQILKIESAPNLKPAPGPEAGTEAIKRAASGPEGTDMYLQYLIPVYFRGSDFSQILHF